MKERGANTIKIQLGKFGWVDIK